MFIANLCPVIGLFMWVFRQRVPAVVTISLLALGCCHGQLSVNCCWPIPYNERHQSNRYKNRLKIADGVMVKQIFCC